MEKLTISISPEEWGSLITKYSADSKKVTIADFTDGTINVDTDVTGDLTKRKGGPDYNPTALAAAPKDQYEAIFSDGARHLLVVAAGEIKYSSGDGIFNTIVNGSGFTAGANFEFATTQDRVYGGNAANSSIVYDRVTSYGGVAYSAPRIKSMGAQAPGSAPTAAIAAGGAVPVGSHTYKVTYLYYDFEESNGSPASNVATTNPGNQTVNLTSVPVGGYGVTARKIYRDDNDGVYTHVGTITNNTATTFSDTVAVGVTPTLIPEFNNTPPVFGIVTLWLDRLWEAKVPGDPSTLFYSETSMPDINRPENQLLCNQEDPITGFLVYFDRLLIWNRRSMGQILGKTSDTFRYSVIPSSVGCVDNRSIQIRVVNGVPIVLWLSDRGFYSYDGNALNYISDEIEDLVNFNIQQALQQKNSNTQTSQTQFLSGTPSTGINLTSIPDSITTKGFLDGTSTPGSNPRRTWNDQNDWESGSQVENLALHAGDNLLKPVERKTFVSSFPGVRAGNMDASLSTVKLQIRPNFTGQPDYPSTEVGASLGPGPTSRFAQKIDVVANGGTINNISIRVRGLNGTTDAERTFKITVWSNSSGQPGSVLAQSSSFIVPTGSSPTQFSFNPNIVVPTAQDCFIGIASTINGNAVFPMIRSTGSAKYTTAYRQFRNSVWETKVSELAIIFSFSQTPIVASGTWTSHTIDTFSTNLDSAAITSVGSWPNIFGSKSFSVIVEASIDSLFWSEIFISSSRSALSSAPVTISGQRYFRIRILMSTSDDRETDTVNTLSLIFPTTVEWISSTIDCTADVTTFNSYSNVSNATGGSLTFLIATSDDDIIYTPYVTFASAVVKRYVKLKIVLTSSPGIPYVNSITFTWTLTANFISSGIDTGVTPPAGWDLFLAGLTLNGGTVQFQMRSAATLGGLTAATFFTVTVNDFPSSVTPLQFVQWKVLITSSDGAVPIVDSVTIQWLISTAASIRPASIFVDGRYYISLALVDETINTVLLELDLKGKWRRHAGLNISTFSFFFNRPYCGMADSGKVRKFLDGITDNGTPVEFDVRFRAEDFTTRYQNNSYKVKVVGEVILQGTNTGASFQVFYSVDDGETFTAMRLNSGSYTFVSSNDGQSFHVRFRPEWDTVNAVSGRTIMYRVYSNDANEVELSGLEATAYLRKQAPVITN